MPGRKKHQPDEGTSGLCAKDTSKSLIGRDQWWIMTRDRSLATAKAGADFTPSGRGILSGGGVISARESCPMA